MFSIEVYALKFPIKCKYKFSNILINIINVYLMYFKYILFLHTGQTSFIISAECDFLKL